MFNIFKKIKNTITEAAVLAASVVSEPIDPVMQPAIDYIRSNKEVIYKSLGTLAKSKLTKLVAKQIGIIAISKVLYKLIPPPFSLVVSQETFTRFCESNTDLIIDILFPED